MKKSKLANLLKSGILLLGILILLFSCEKDGYINIENTDENKFLITDNSFSDFQYDKSYKKVNNLLKQLIKGKNLQSKSGKETYDFTVDTTKVRKIQIDSTTTYTFLIKRGTKNSLYFENLVLNFQKNKEPEALIIKYKPKNGIRFIEEHNSYDFEGEFETNKIEFNKINFASKVTCNTVNMVYCNVTGGGYNGDHVADSNCYSYALNNGFDGLYNTTRTTCSASSETFSPTVGEITDLGSPSGGGGGAGAGKPSTAPLVPCAIGENDISDDGLCSSGEPLDLGILADLTNAQYNWVTTNPIVKSYLENLLNLGMDLNTLKLFTAKAIDILKKDKATSILTTKFENELFVNLTGDLLFNLNSNIFADYNILFNNLDTANVLSVSDWQIMSQKINDIHSISLLNNINNQTLFDQLSVSDQQLVLQNSLFINFLPNLKDLGIELPQTAEEWVEFGEILVEVMYEIIPDLIPGIAELNSLKNSISAFNSGNYTDGTTELVFALIGVFPAGKLMKALAKFAKLAKKTAKIFKVYLKLFKLNKPLAKGYKRVIKIANDMDHIFDIDHKLATLVSNAGGEKEALLAAVNRIHELGLYGAIPNGRFKRFTNISVLGESLTIDIYKNLDGSITHISNMWKP